MTRQEMISEINHTRSGLRVLYGYGGRMISYDCCNVEQLKKIRLGLFRMSKMFEEYEREAK